MIPLSVIIASHNPGEPIRVCLAALVAQCSDRLAEVILADSSTDGTERHVAEAFPMVRLLHFEQPLTLAQLRGHAIAASSGEVVAILDPYSVVDVGWVEAVLQAHLQHQHPVIGGMVDFYEEQRPCLTAWAIYVNEYGGFAPPLAAGEVSILPGSNISYKRGALGDVEHLAREGFWKTFVNWDLGAQGPALWLEPAMAVRLYKPIPFAEFFRSRYDHGRCFAAMRTAHAPRRERALRAALAPLLPMVFLWRLWTAIRCKGVYRTRFLQTGVLQALLFTSWAWGEFCGYLAGSRRSCSRLFY